MDIKTKIYPKLSVILFTCYDTKGWGGLPCPLPWILPWLFCLLAVNNGQEKFRPKRNKPDVNLKPFQFHTCGLFEYGNSKNQNYNRLPLLY